MKHMLMIVVALTAKMAFAAEAVLPSTASQAKLVDAQYTEVATKTEVRYIPGCHSGGEAGNNCYETVVLESQPAIVANISYRDSMTSGEGNDVSWATVTLNMADFSASEVASLQAVYPQWKHPFSNVPRKFAKDNLSMNVARVQKTIQVVDMRRSHLCQPQGETGMPVPGCVETIVYKNATTTQLVATVSVK